jgi:hypothetical protein
LIALMRHRCAIRPLVATRCTSLHERFPRKDV